VSHHLQDEDLLGRVADAANQPVLVAADFEDDAFAKWFTWKVDHGEIEFTQAKAGRLMALVGDAVAIGIVLFLAFAPTIPYVISEKCMSVIILLSL
jgi:hypothetical protein